MYPIHISDYVRLSDNDHIPHRPVSDHVMTEWAHDAVQTLIENFDGTYSCTTVTSGDGMVVAQIQSDGTIHVYYCRIQDTHLYFKRHDA